MTGSVADVARAIRDRERFVITSHARPDGDAVGSSLALAFALEQLGKTVRVVSRDRVPSPYVTLPGTDRIEIVSSVEPGADAAIILECPDLGRPGIAGFESHFIINVDHHLGNQFYGAVNWFDESAAACGEMVLDVIDALGAPLTQDVAAHLYLAISTDTGGFHHGHMTARTFEACRRIAETGLDPAALSRLIFDSYGIGRVKLTGALLAAMELHDADRMALLTYDDALLSACDATVDDTEGLVNLPLGAKDVVVSVLFKAQSDGTQRLSLRSKGDIDVRAVAARWGGGGHKNASGCTIAEPLDAAKRSVIALASAAIAAAR